MLFSNYKLSTLVLTSQNMNLIRSLVLSFSMAGGLSSQNIYFQFSKKVISVFLISIKYYQFPFIKTRLHYKIVVQIINSVHTTNFLKWEQVRSFHAKISISYEVYPIKSFQYSFPINYIYILNFNQILLISSIF